MEFLVVAGVLAGVAAVASAAIRVVPAGHCGVVTRCGRPVRPRPTGLVPVLPLIERVTLICLNPAPIDPVVVTATTRDGVGVRLVLSVLWRVIDPFPPVRAGVDARLATADAVERTTHHLVAAVGLEALMRSRELLLTSLTQIATERLEDLGLQVIDIELLDAEVRLGPQLLELLT